MKEPEPKEPVQPTVETSGEPKNWYSLCSPKSGCCPEYGFTEGGVLLREHGIVIKLSDEQWEQINQQHRLRRLDRDSRV